LDVSCACTPTDPSCTCDVITTDLCACPDSIVENGRWECAEDGCVAVCDAGWLDCDGVTGCEHDTNECGEKCCGNGEVCCDGDCVDPLDDKDHCGACGVACVTDCE